MITLFTIPVTSIIFMLISALVTIIFPIIVGVYLHRKFNLNWRFFMIGALVFVIFALVIEGFINSTLINRTELGNLLKENILLMALYGGFMAALFEEAGRYIGFKYFMKKDNDPSMSLMVGAGHGGIEAILIVGLGLISNVFIASLINSNSEILSFLESSDPQNYSLIMESFETLSEMSPPLFLLAGLERVTVIFFHISLSVFVFKAAKNRKQISYLFLAFFLHFIFDFVVVLVADSISMYLVELIMIVATIPVAYLAFKQVKSMIEELKESQIIENTETEKEFVV